MSIAAFGLYALSAYSVQRRSREIVLRKLYGAGRHDIAWLVMKEIGLLIACAALVGLPVAAVAIQNYLAAYVEHAAIGYWTLLFALLTALLIAALAALRHTLIAMRMLPAAALTN
jgi:ABC-type antimicrobial peptide transport system permease subunit